MIPSLLHWNLHGPVRTLRNEFAEWDVTTENWRDPQRVTFVQFRPDGKVSERRHQNPNGSISTETYSYDSTAHRLLEVRFQLDDGPFTKRVYHYDELGRSARTFMVDEKGIEQDLEIYRYDDAGLKTKLQYVPKFEGPACSAMYGVEGAEQAYTAQGAETITTAYDERGQSREAVFHDTNQRVVLRVTLTRDSVGRLRDEQAQQGDASLPDIPPDTPAEERAAAEKVFEQLFGPGRVWARTTYRYDDQGRQVERHRSFSDMDVTRTTWIHDEHDNPVRQIDEHVSCEVNLDEAGNLQHSKEKLFKSESRFDYRYDDQGNWIERIVSVRPEVNPEYQRRNIERREITYYR